MSGGAGEYGIRHDTFGWSEKWHEVNMETILFEKVLFRFILMVIKDVWKANEDQDCDKGLLSWGYVELEGMSIC